MLGWWEFQMFFVVYDATLRDQTLGLIKNEKKTVEQLYDVIQFWIDKIFEFSQKESTLPAKFASRVFLEGNVWDYALEARVVPAIFQLLITAMGLPLWINWADMELGEEIVRLVFVFSSASQVQGLPGQVIVAQFSDDDRKVEVEYAGEKMEITTLLGAVALLLAVGKYLRKNIDLVGSVKTFNELMKQKLKEALLLKG